MDRRSFLVGGACALAGAAVATPAVAQDALPEGTLKILVGFPPGGATDLLTRQVADHVRATLGRHVLVVNQPGATGMISIEHLKRSPADGSVVSLIPMTSGLIFPMFRSKVAFDFQQDFEPIVSLVTYPLAFSVPNKLGVEDWASYLKWAKANPKELFYGHGGTGSMAQLLGVMIGSAAGLTFQEVSYKGGADLVSALVGGHVQGGVNVAAEVSPQHTAGRLRILAVSSKVRAPGLPSVPTFLELGYPTVQSEPWFGFFAPKGTPAPAIAAWNNAVNKALQDPALIQTLQGQGFFVGGGTTEGLRTMVNKDAVHWRRVMASSGFKTID